MCVCVGVGEEGRSGDQERNEESVIGGGGLHRCFKKGDNIFTTSIAS